MQYIFVKARIYLQLTALLCICISYLKTFQLVREFEQGSFPEGIPAETSRNNIIIIYLSWSWATCWPVPVSRIQKYLQRSAM